MNLDFLSSASAATGFAFLAEVALKSTALLAGAALIALVLRRASAAYRHLIWAAALGAMVALPALLLALPAWRVSSPAFAWFAPRPETEVISDPERAATAGAPEAEVRAGLSDPSLPTDPGATTPLAAATTPVATPAAGARAEAAPIHRAPFSWPRLLFTLWALGALAVLATFAAGHAVLRVMLRDARPVRDGEWHALALEAADHLRLTAPFALLRGRATSIPVAFGLFRPRVLLPEGADQWPVELRRAILLHELAHVQRHDCATQAVAQLACALYWFHPAAWWAASRLRVERERACDDRVLAARTRASDYADHLLGMVRALRATRLAALGAVAFARPSSLEGRLIAVLDPRRDRRAVSARHALPAVAMAAVFVVPFAALEPAAVGANPTTVKTAKHLRYEELQPNEWKPSRVVPVPDSRQSLAQRAEWARADARRANVPVWWIGWQLERNAPGEGGQLNDTEGIHLSILNKAGFFTLDDVLSGRDHGTSAEDSQNARDSRPMAMLIRMDAQGPGRVRVQTYQLPVEFDGEPLYWLDQVPAEQSFEWLRDAAEHAKTIRVRAGLVESIGYLDDSEPALAYLRSTLDGTDNQHVRRAAAEALRHHPSSEHVKLLARHARTDRDVEVRRASVEALGGFQTPEALEELLALARAGEGSSEVRRSAFDALGEKIQAGAPDHSVPVPEIDPEEARAMARGYEDAQDLAGGAMAKAEKAAKQKGDKEGRLSLSGEEDVPSVKMPQAEYEVQRQAIESLGRYPEAQSLPRLRRIAETSPSADLRGQAVESIGRLGTEGAFAALDQIVWRNRSQSARERAVEAIGRRFPAQRALEKLGQIAADHPSLGCRRMAVEAIGRIEGPEALAALERFADASDDPDIQRQAIESMGRRGEEGIEARLLQIVRTHARVDTRRQAVESIGRRGGKQAADRLMEIAKADGPDDVRRQAAESLGRLDDPRVKGMLLELARSHSSIDVERQAVESLGRLEADVMPELAEIARSHPSSEVRRQAVESMTRRDPDRALPYLEEILRDPKHGGTP
jgi:HEAT repeat protein/beta-lactamase regulating signal transducer with metallopeptidase domain